MASCAVLLAVLLQTQGHDTTPVYRDHSAGIQLTIPAGWVRTPDSILQAGIRIMVRHGADPNHIHYLAAFSLATAPDWHAYPYAIVQLRQFDPEDSLPPHLLDSLALIFNTVVPAPVRNDFIASAPQHMSALRDSVSDALRVDLGLTQMAGGRWVRGYAAIKVSCCGIIAINVYGIASDSLETTAIRDRFLAGFRVDLR